MAQTALPRRRSWSAEASARSVNASSQWVRNERHRELKQLEQEAKRSTRLMKAREIEIHEQSAQLEKLKKRDSQRVAKISDLSREVEEQRKGENETEGHGEGESETKQASEELQEELARLKQDHTGSQTMMEEMKISIEQKKSEVDRLAVQHKGLCERIVKEEQALQAVELEESMQQSVAVQHEMRSLSEDLKRLGNLMEDLSPNSLPDQHKQNSGETLKLRAFRGDANSGTRSVARTSHERISLEHGRFSLWNYDRPSSSRTKEPVEFEEREGSNRKRHKNSSFEQQLERLHEQRERLQIEAHEKQMLLESVARLSSQSRDTTHGLVMSSRKGSAISQPTLSPSSIFEGFKDNPSIGPGRPPSAESSSASSDVSSEDTTVEKPEEGVVSSIVKRLSFGHPSSSEIYTRSVLEHVGTGESCISTENVSERDDNFGKDCFDSIALEVGYVGSFSDNVKEQALMRGNGSKEEFSAAEGEIENSPQLGSSVKTSEGEYLFAGSEVNEIDKLEEEVGSLGDAGIQEIFPNVDPGANEDEATRSPLSNKEEQSLSARCHKIRRSLEMLLDSKNVESSKEIIGSSLHPVAPSYQQEDVVVAAKQGYKPQTGQNEDDILAREASATNDDEDENRLWRQNAENQIEKLSSQLSFLHQKVEFQVKMQDEMKKPEYIEESTAATEQLSKQVSCFGDEVNELRHSMQQLQQNFLKEIESRSIAEHSVQHFRAVCTEQSAKLDHLGTQVSHLARELEEQLKVRAELEGKLDKEAQERLKVEAELKDLSQAVALTSITKGKGGEELGELVEQQKILLVNQLKEAEKLRTVAEVRVLTLDKQVEQLEMVYDVAQDVQEVLKFQDKILKFGLQTLFQLLMLGLCVSTLYSRVADAIKSSLIPT